MCGYCLVKEKTLWSQETDTYTIHWIPYPPGTTATSRVSICKMAKFPISVLFLVLVIGIGNGTAKLCCVTPEEMEPCPKSCQENCYTLMYYVNNTEEYFTTSNTTFLFLAGEHALQNGTFIHDISDLTLIHDVDNTSNASQATLMCDGTGGLSFFNITNLTITGLRLVGCSKHSHKFNVFVAVEMSLIFNLKMLEVSIHDTTGFGLMTDGLLGTATIKYVTIDSSHSASYAYGGNFAIYCNDWQFLNYSTNHSLTVSDSQFLNGTNKYKGYDSQASGIYVHISCHINMSITFNRINVKGNFADKGGNIGIMYVSNSSQWTVVTSILNSHISDGSADIGGGLFMTAVVVSGGKSSKINTMHVLNVINTTFSRNKSPTLGGGVYLRLHENYVFTIGLFTFQNCTFSGNAITMSSNDFEEHGGVAVHVLTYLRPEYMEHLTPLFKVKFTNCTFSQNAIQYLPAGDSGNLSSRNGVFFVQNVKSLSLQNCTFVNNTCAAVIAINTNLLLHDWNHIQNNSGTRGGGMVFCAGSLMHLKTGTTLNITQNNATQYGGGIYVEDDCTQVIPYCFFQVDNVNANTSVLNKTNVNLIHNVAGLAGSALYGGLVDSCTLIDKVFARHYPPQVSSMVFNATFRIESDSTSKISSDPMQVHFCKDHSILNCSNLTEHIVPGATFQVSVILMGQRNGFVPGVVDAQCSDNCTLGESQKSQLADSPNCSVLTYTIFADENTNKTLSLVAEDSYYEYTDLSGTEPSIILHVETCPLGFKVQNQECKCILSQVECNISSRTITRQPPSWIGYMNKKFNTSDIIFHRFCPLGYCYDTNVTITTNSTYFDQDAQCVQNRHGLLCGACQPNYSLGFGSHDCMHCASNMNSLRTTGLIFVCALAGLFLVMLLTLLNLTVSQGTLNGLIFYANIVQVNSDIFFSSESHARFLATFIAWLNLDFGIKVCFFDGMDEYAKTWLQFVFPLYIWLISGVIVYFGWNYNIVARLAGKNAVNVLATLFLLSFGKLLRTIIAAIAYTIVESPESAFSVWLPDAEVRYLRGRHIVLFAFAIIAAVITLMYTLSLLFIQCLRKLSGISVFSWVERMKPLFDAYTGPYKDKYHFWTGLLLLARIFLFICFAVNATNGPALNLTLIIIVCSILMIATHIQVYKHVVLGLLENFMYLNLILFSTTMMLLLQIKRSEFKPAAAYTFGGSVLLAFFGIVAYHAYKRVLGTQRFGQLKVWCQERRWTKQVARIQPVVIPRDESEGSDESDSANEMDSLLTDAENPSMDATQLREPLIGSTR